MYDALGGIGTELSAAGSLVAGALERATGGSVDVQISVSSDGVDVQARFTDTFATPLGNPSDASASSTIGYERFAGDADDMLQRLGPDQNGPTTQLSPELESLQDATLQAMPDRAAPEAVQALLGRLEAGRAEPMLLNLQQIVERAAPMLDPQRALSLEPLRTPGALAALSRLIDPAVLAGIPKILAPTAQRLTQFVQLALAAKSPAEYTLLAAQLGAIVARGGAQDLPALVAQLQTQAQQASNALYGIPGLDPRATLGAEERKQIARGGRVDRRERGRLDAATAQPPPDLDDRGRPYSPERRARLAQLAVDPRSGFAPEGQAALEAEEHYGLRFTRATDGVHEFVDHGGEPWHVIAPLHAGALHEMLRRATQSGHVIVYLLRTPPAAVNAVKRAVHVYRTAQPGTRRVITILPEL